MPAEFVHLHCHSEYSLLDGANRLDRLAGRARELEMPALALTDHGNLFGALQFQKACDKAKIKPLFGCEVYVSPSGRADRSGPDARRNQHFVLLAENEEGWGNLARLTSLAYLEGFYYKPRIDKEILAEHSKGLIALSACVKGVVADYIMEDDMAAAERSLDDYVQILGRENFYMELMDHGLDFQKKVNDGILELARRHSLPLVGTNDCHYLGADDHVIHDVLLCIQTGKTRADEKRMRMDVNEFYVKTPEQMIGLFGHIDGAISNTLAVAERCNARIPLGRRLLPRYQPPDGKDEESYLRERALAGLDWRYGGRAEPRHRERLDFELGVIHRMGFDSYFLVVWDFINHAREKKIPVGPGRGSGAGSIVAFCLGITDLCPLEHGLFFERFLNPERVSMPDFDIDFCFERRGEVIDYVKNKYGERNVAQIITFAKMKAKAAIHDVGRVLGVPLDHVNRVAKLVPEGPKATLESALDESEELRQLYEGDDVVRELLDNAKAIEGTVRHSSVHAAGVVIADQDLTRLIPLYKDPKTEGLVTQWTMGEVEEVGLLKMDFLGLKTLTFIDKTIKEVKRTRGIDIDWATIPLDDPDTYRLLQSGDAFGLFQLESGGMRDLLTQLRPSKFSDVVALISLYRPGPMENIPEFIERKHGRKPIEYQHPDLEPILKETYGIIVYQEQVMQIVQTLAGFSLGQADMLRRAMGKKKADVMAEQEGAFVKGCASFKGIPERLAVEIFKVLAKFAEYGFNKSHSAAYTMVTFQTAWLKAHFPIEFHAQLLTSEIGGSDEKMAAYMSATAARGIEILPPDIQESMKLFAVAGENVRFGLVAIKNVGEGVVEALIEEREANGPFKSLQDFVERMPPRSLNSRVVECLIKCGVFDRFGHNRPSLLAALPAIMEHAGTGRREKEVPQSSLFDAMSADDLEAMKTQVPIPRKEDWPEAEKLEIEKSLAGYFLSGHPLERYRPDLEAFVTAGSAAIKTMPKDAEVFWVGMVKSFGVRNQKSDGRPWAMVVGEDREGTVDLNLFAEVFAKSREAIREGKVIAVAGKVNHWNDRVSVRVNEAMDADTLRRTRVKGIDLALAAGAVTEANLTRLRDILKAHPGRKPVRVFVTEGDATVAVAPGGGFGFEATDRSIRALQEAKFVRRIAFRTNGKG